jgi:predicted RNase H-like HicB family nuclease
MIIEYIALAEKVSDGYSVFFPDIPGCGSAGDSLEEARHNAREALLAHLELILENCEKIPTPSTLDIIVTLPESKSALLLNIIIITPTKKSQRINITLDQDLLESLDKLASRQHRTRSALLAEAAQNLLSAY